MIGPWEGYIMDGFRVSIFCKEAMYVWRSSKICKVKGFFLISNSLPLHIYISTKLLLAVTTKIFVIIHLVVIMNHACKYTITCI